MKKNIKEMSGDIIEDLKKPLELSDSWSFIKKGKIRIVIIYEDLSYIEHYKKLKEDYVITIKAKKYVIVPKCFLFGKYNTLIYYYNNPFPIGFKYEKSKLTSADLYSKKQMSIMTDTEQESLKDVVIDAQSLHVAMTSNLVNKMYNEGKMSTLNYIIIGVVILAVILIILHVAGVIDLYSVLGVKTQ